MAISLERAANIFAHSSVRKALQSPPGGDFLVVPNGKSLAEYFGSMSDRTGIARYVTADGGKGTVYFNCRAIAPDR